MKPLLTIFLDGLRFDSIECMPFLSSMPYKRKLKTLLGYSATCHATMYTGVYPEKHLLWFIWMLSPQTSPFLKIKTFLKYEGLDNLVGRLLLHKLVEPTTNINAVFGLPRIVHLPLRYWAFMDVSEKKLWTDPGYLETYPTIFDILREEGVDFEVVGISRKFGYESEVVKAHKINKIYPWTYFFIGDVDHFSHRFGQDSEEGKKRLRTLDRLIEEKYIEFKKKVGEFNLIIFSDHGHLKVKNRIDPYKFFKKKGENLNRFIHVIDINFIRFWFRNDRERTKIEKILIDLPGFILTDELQVKYHVKMPDNRYGDLIFYLDAPNIFSKTIWGFSRSEVSNHGYLPEYEESNGVFLSNFDLDEMGFKKDYVELTHILPLHLSLLGVKRTYEALHLYRRS